MIAPVLVTWLDSGVAGGSRIGLRGRRPMTAATRAPG
jgi:hypothetical protein